MRQMADARVTLMPPRARLLFSLFIVDGVSVLQLAQNAPPSPRDKIALPRAAAAYALAGLHFSPINYRLRCTRHSFLLMQLDARREPCHYQMMRRARGGSARDNRMMVLP